MVGLVDDRIISNSIDIVSIFNNIYRYQNITKSFSAVAFISVAIVYISFYVFVFYCVYAKIQQSTK